MASEATEKIRQELQARWAAMHPAEDWAGSLAHYVMNVAAEARREALEEAAALADRYAQRCERCPYPESCRHSGGRDVASYIRELKEDRA